MALGGGRERNGATSGAGETKMVSCKGEKETPELWEVATLFFFFCRDGSRV